MDHCADCHTVAQLWMRLLTIPNQSSVPRAWDEFDSQGRMKDGPLYRRIVDVAEELMRFTLLTRDLRDTLVDRYSKRHESDESLSRRVITSQKVS